MLHQEIVNSLKLSAEVQEFPDATDDYSVGAVVDQSIEVGDTFLGTLFSDDTDVIEVDLTAGVQYTFTVEARVESSFDPFDSLIFVLDQFGNEVAFNDDIDFFGGLLNSSTNFTVAANGTYKLVVTTHDQYYGNPTSGANFYTLSLSEAEMLTEWNFDQIADYLTYGGWGNNSYPWNISPSSTLTYDVDNLTVDGRYLAEKALDAWSAVTGITFQKVSSNAQIEFDDNQSGAFAQFYTNGVYVTAAEVNVSTQWLVDNGTTLDSYSFQTYIHEIGHALGLAHAGDYDGSATYGVNNVYLNDSWQQTIMSYFDQDDNTYVDASFAYVVMPQIGDILAMQDLYGTANNLRTGNTTYGDNGSGAGFYSEIMTLDNVTYTIIDNGGIDTLDASSHNGSQTVYLESETYSDLWGEVGNIGIARGTIIENFEGGSGQDLVFGNDANNTLNGNGGNDSIYAGDGDDTVNGGSGADRLVGNAGDDTLNGGTGNDILKGKDGNNTLNGENGDDKLIASNTGNDTLNGGDGSDILSGLGGDDLLMGGNHSDFMYGGRDNDQLYGGDDADILRGNRNDDQLFGENGSDSLYGGGNNDYLEGGADKDYLLGENGNDELDGGTGDDNLTGGDGIDTFVYKNASYGYDRVLDFENGIDLIDLSDFGYSGMGDINPIASDVASGVRINFGNGNVLLLEGITEAQLDAGDFVF